MDKFNETVDSVDSELAKLPYLPLIDAYSGIPQAKTYALLSLSAVYVVLVFFNIASALLVNVLGFVYPAYASFKAIESINKDDDTQWLVYWTVFGFFVVAEQVVGYFGSSIPFYYVIKLVAILYLALPQTNGAQFVYTTFLRPYLVQEEGQVDSAFTKMTQNVTNAVHKASSGNKEA